MKEQYTYNDYLDALRRNEGHRRRTADDLKISLRTLMRGIKALKERGEDIPTSPYLVARSETLVKAVQAPHDSAPEGYIVKGVSSFHDGETGEVKSFWLKTQVDHERKLALMKAAIEELCIEIPPQEPITLARRHLNEKLCNLVTFSDYHMGMLAWRREGGDDWDLQIAERTLLGCFEQMVLNSPRARVGFLNQLGDFLHTDGLIPVTPAHHHVLDADSRFQKIVATTIRVLRHIVNRMLQVHEEVHVLMAEGNHDPTGSIWLQQMFSALYENEPRVKVVDSPLPYYAHQHGLTMLAFHHGHLSKMGSLPGLLAAQFPEMWGATTKRYCHTGHKHHVDEKEHPGMIVTQHPTLAAADAYAARGGWYSERAAQLITYHSQYGQVGRTIVTPEMIQ